MEFNIEDINKWFKWFTEEVINDRKIYSDNTLATARVNDKAYELAEKLGANHAFTPYDVVLWREKNSGKQLILTMEHENFPDWPHIKEDFEKLLWSKSLIKMGIFYIRERDENSAEKRVKDYLDKMRNMIINTEPKLSDEQWLIILGVRYQEGIFSPSDKIYFKGYTLEGNQIKNIGIKEL